MAGSIHFRSGEETLSRNMAAAVEKGLNPPQHEENQRQLQFAKLPQRQVRALLHSDSSPRTSSVGSNEPRGNHRHSEDDHEKQPREAEEPDEFDADVFVRGVSHNISGDMSERHVGE